MSYRNSYLIMALWAAFILATACAGVMPRISQAAAILCPGRFEIDASSPKNIKHFCRDERTGELRRINPFLIAGTNMAAFAAVLLIPAAILGGLRDRAEAGPRRQRQELRAAAVPTTATVRTVREGATAVKRAGRHTRDVELVLGLEVEGSGGRYVTRPRSAGWSASCTLPRSRSASGSPCGSTRPSPSASTPTSSGPRWRKAKG
jgi:hypothetical protein